MIPTYLVILPLLATFCLITWQYWAIDSRRRILNLRFLLAFFAVVAMFYYLYHAYNFPNDREMSWLFEAIALSWLGLGVWLLIHMPPHEVY